MNSYSRRKALKIILASGAGTLLLGCGAEPSPKLEEPIDTIPPVNEPDTAQQIEELLKSADVIFVYPEDENYAEVNTYFNKRIEKKPAIIALCKSTKGVSDAVKLARLQTLKLAVRSGGHSFEGYSNIDGGLVINLSGMKSLSWEEDGTLTAEAGVVLKELYEEILPKGKVLPAGSCATVGLPGLTLGGGYGFFSRKYGLTCDNLLSATLVDVNGEIHQVDQTHELMWALKGGGNGNFGVVTKLNYQTHDAPATFSRSRLKAYDLDAERAVSLLEGWFEATKALGESCFSAFVLNNKRLTVLITNYDKSDESAVNMHTQLLPSYDKESTLLEQPLAKALETYYGIQKPIYFRNSSAGLYSSFEDVKPCIKEMVQLVIDSPGMIYQVNTLGGQIANATYESNSCYPHRSRGYLSELQTYWQKKKDHEGLKKAFGAFLEILVNNGITSQYRNYPSAMFTSPQTSYYGKENYSKLRTLKSKYDPEDVLGYAHGVKPLQ